jgi:isoleucyl-tRNA synthetase
MSPLTAAAAPAPVSLRAADPAVVVSFPVDGDEHGASLVAWTTTPWTLPSNLALCVHPEMDYIKARDPGEVLGC